MAISTLTQLVDGEMQIFGQEGKREAPGVFEYADGKRTDNPRRDGQGRPLFRHSANARVGAEQAGEVTLLLPTSEPLGVFQSVQLAPGAEMTIRPNDAFSLAITIVGELATALKKG